MMVHYYFVRIDCESSQEAEEIADTLRQEGYDAHQWLDVIETIETYAVDERISVMVTCLHELHMTRTFQRLSQNYYCATVTGNF